MKILKALIYTSIIVIGCLSASCNKKSIHSKADLITYINDPAHGLKKTNEIGQVKAELLFKPWQLVASNGNKKNERASKLQNKYFFVLSLSANDHELLRQLPFDEYSTMVQVLAFRMIEFISIVPDVGKSVEPEDCLFQQTYGMSDANQLLIIFNKANLEKANILNVKINEFGLNIGNLNFKINTSDIKDLPSIALNK